MQGKREGLLWVIIAILVAIIIKQRHGKTIKRWWQAYQHRHKQKRKWSLKPQSPEQCPSCQAEVELRSVNVESARPISSRIRMQNKPALTKPRMIDEMSRTEKRNRPHMNLPLVECALLCLFIESRRRCCCLSRFLSPRDPTCESLSESGAPFFVKWIHWFE